MTVHANHNHNLNMHGCVSALYRSCTRYRSCSHVVLIGPATVKVCQVHAAMCAVHHDVCAVSTVLDVLRPTVFATHSVVDCPCRYGYDMCSAVNTYP